MLQMAGSTRAATGRAFRLRRLRICATTWPVRTNSRPKEKVSGKKGMAIAIANHGEPLLAAGRRRVSSVDRSKIAEARRGAASHKT